MHSLTSQKWLTVTIFRKWHDSSAVWHFELKLQWWMKEHNLYSTKISFNRSILLILLTLIQDPVSRFIGRVKIIRKIFSINCSIKSINQDDCLIFLVSPFLFPHYLLQSEWMNIFQEKYQLYNKSRKWLTVTLWLTWNVMDYHGWLSWMTFMDDFHGQLSWTTFIDNFHGQLSWILTTWVLTYLLTYYLLTDIGTC